MKKITENSKHSRLGTKHPKILIVDDEKDIVEILTMILRDAGYEVNSTANQQTIEKVYAYLPDLILLDLWMEGVDGGGICKYLKNHKSTKHIPIIIFSANQDIERIAKKVGADDFIPKPFEMKDLLARVKSYIN